MKVLILETATSPHKRTKAVVDICRRLKPDAAFIAKSIHTLVRGLRSRSTKGKYNKIPHQLLEPAMAALQTLVASAQPDLVLTYCPITAQLLAPEFGNIQKISKHAGSTGRVQGYRFMLLADPALLYMPDQKAETVAAFNFMMTRHLSIGLHHQPAPEFKYVPALSVEGLDLCRALAKKSIFAACDIESQGPVITAIGFCFALSENEEDLFNVTIPLYWPRRDGDNPWATEEMRTYAWETILHLFTCGLPLAFQNGNFDATQLAQYGLVPTNYCLDTLVMAHAFYPSVPKSLAFQASTCLHEYVFWKDEGKEQDEKGEAKYRAPGTVTGYLTYLEYCGKDNWYTARLVLHYFREFVRMEQEKYGYTGMQFLRNFVRLMLVHNGPVMAMNWHGLKVNDAGVEANTREGEDEYEENANHIRMLTADPNFNLGSWQQVQKWIYKIMRAPPVPRKGQTTDKRVLKVLAQTYPIIYPFVEAMGRAKKASQINGRFGTGLKSWTGWQGKSVPARFYTQFSPIITKTSRLNSRTPLIGRGAGTNLQNVTDRARRCLRADDGCALLSIDLNQADVWHMAAACGDPRMIETVMTPGNDSHSIHAADFFCEPLEAVLCGKKAKEPWVTDYETGIRNLVKKVVHGTNYGLGAFGMVINVGRPAAVAIVQKLITNEASREMFYHYLRQKGIYSKLMEVPAEFAASAASWDINRLQHGCAFVQMQYLSRYPVLRDFRDNGVMQKLQATNGKITVYGPHIFQVLASGSSHEIRRFACSAYGQAGTAGSINNAMMRFTLNEKNDYLHEAGISLVLQIHDENVFQLPKDRGELVYDLHSLMEIEAEYEGTTFTIPCEADVSPVWGKGGDEWTPRMSIAETKDLVLRNAA